MDNKAKKLGNASLEVLGDTEGDTGAFEKAVARAEKLSQLARQAAEGSIVVSQEVIARLRR